MQQSKRKVSTGSVYLLWHTDPYGDEKLLGVYTTRSAASSAEERFKGKPGFSQGGVFEIAKYSVNKDYWTEGFVRHQGFSLPTWFRPDDTD